MDKAVLTWLLQCSPKIYTLFGLVAGAALGIVAGIVYLFIFYIW